MIPSSRSDITPHHNEDDSSYVPHSPTPSPPTSPPPVDVPSSPSPPPDPPLPGFWLNTDNLADYYPFSLPVPGFTTVQAKYIKYEGGSNPRVLGTMGPNQPVYAEPIILPHPPITNPLPLSPQQHQQLLFGSELADQINGAINDMGELPMHAELECYRWAHLTIQTNLNLIHKYQKHYQEVVHRRELCVNHLENNHFWECISTYLPSRIPPPRMTTNPPPALVVCNLTSHPFIHTELPQLQDELSSHAAQNQQSLLHPIPVPPHQRKGKKKDKGKRKASPHPCFTCGQDDHHTNDMSGLH